MPRNLSALLIATALCLGGCASSQASTREDSATQAPANTNAQAPCPMCPMTVQGTKVEATDVDGGVALTFTTATGDVSQLRSQVAQMAERHNTMHEQRANSPRGMPMAASKATVEEVPGGAKLVLTADDPSQVGSLREMMHHHAEMMAQGGCMCPGMHGGPGPHGPGGQKP